MSDEKITLDLLGSRVLTLTAELRDVHLRLGALEHRFTALEARFSGIEGRLGSLESRFGAQEERMSAMLGLLVRVRNEFEGGAR